MSWFLDVILVTVLLIAIWAQHLDLVDTRHRVDDLGAANTWLYGEVRKLRGRLVPMPEERRAAARWSELKET
jgi:hypothetical protein